MATLLLAAWACLLVLWAWISPTSAAWAPTHGTFLPCIVEGDPVMTASPTASDATQSKATDREALTAFKNGQFDRVISLLETLQPGRDPSREILRLGLLSYLRLGQPEAALQAYSRLVLPGRSEDHSLLRELAWAFLVNRVRDPHEHVRIAAYTGLAELASREAIPLLDDGLLDSSIAVRTRAAEGLGRAAEQIKQARSADAGLPGVTATGLTRALADPAPAVRIAALNALGEIGGPGVADRLLHITRTEDGPASVFALGALVKLGNPEALSELLNAATLPDAATRMAALGVLGRLRRASSLSLLSQSVYDPDPSVRAFAAGAIGEFGDPAGAAALTHALGDEHPRVRSVAAASLGRLGAAQARPLLWQAARDPVEYVRAGAVEGLLRLGDREAILVAADLAKHPDPSVRSAAAQSLGLAGYRPALPVLERLLQDTQPQPRLAAARALGRIGGREAIPILRKALQDSDPSIQVTAAGSLAQLLPTRKR